MAVSHIQNIAPGPPREMARATPAMFAVPTRDAAEMEKARNGEMFRLPSESRPPGSTSVRNISGSSRTCTTPVLMVKYRPVGMRTATRMYDETVLTLSNTPWSISIELSLLRQSCCEDWRFRTPSVVGYSLPPVTAVRRGGVCLGNHLLCRALRNAEAAQPVFSDLSEDRKSTRLNSSHVSISYAVFCLKKKIIMVIQMIRGVRLQNKCPF